MRWQIFYDEVTLVYQLDADEVKRLDERLAALEWALWLGADDFPAVHGFQRLRVARISGFGVAPTIRAFFEIDDDIVTIKWIETISENT